MSCSQILNALDALVEYPDLQEYIKNFDNPCGFMFIVETNEHRKLLKKRLDALLDPNGMHSGGSWGSMLRGVQALLTGVWKREQLLKQIAEEAL